MTRTSLHVLADRAGLWAVSVAESMDVRIDDGNVLRFGANVPEDEVAAVILRHQLGDRPDIEVELARQLVVHGYAMPGLVSIAENTVHLGRASAGR